MVRLLAVTALAITAVVGMSCAKSATEPTPVCTFTIDPAAASFASDGGTKTIAVTASAPTCDWTATAGAAWVTITNGASGTGSGQVQYSVGSQADVDARAATVTAAGEAHAIVQKGRADASCAIVLAPASDRMDAAGGESHFAVVGPAGCGWSASSTAPWLTIVAGGSGSGNGDIRYRGESNAGTSERSGTILVGGEAFTLTQAGQAQAGPQPECDLTTGPASFDVCLSRGSVTSKISILATCSWTATTAATWLTFDSPSSGTGNADITIAHDFNYDAPREATVVVRGTGAPQSIRIAQAGCRYTVSQRSMPMPAAGGTDSFQVTQAAEPMACGGPLQNRCEWTPVADVPWITITNGGVRVGDDPVMFSVAANTTTAQRTGTITVRDQVVIITQPAP
jgi:hypothetical protein